MLLNLLSPRRVLQALDAALTLVGQLVPVPKYFMAPSGGLTMVGTIGAIKRVAQALTAELTLNGSLTTAFIPAPTPPIMLLLRRNQTD